MAQFKSQKQMQSRRTKGPGKCVTTTTPKLSKERKSREKKRQKRSIKRREKQLVKEKRKKWKMMYGGK